MKKNLLFLSLGVAYLLFASFLIIKQWDVNSKFYFIISFSSLIISVGEIIKSIVKYIINRHEIYNFYIKKYSLKNEKEYINTELEKINKHYNFYYSVITVIDFITFTFVFFSLISIPFFKLPEETINFHSNIFSIIGFALLFISLYINDLLNNKAELLEDKIKNKRKEFLKKSK